MCSCGWISPPRVDERRAQAAVETEHGFQSPTCDLCRRDRGGNPLRRYAHLEVITDPPTGDQLLVCRDDQQACRDGAARRQLQLDQAAADALDLQLPRPQLRLVSPSSTESLS